MKTSVLMAAVCLSGCAGQTKLPKGVTMAVETQRLVRLEHIPVVPFRDVAGRWHDSKLEWSQIHLVK